MLKYDINMDELKEHPIAVVERRTGLSAHVIRKWEQRYSAVEPGRSGGGRRLYSEQDIERLQLLHRAVETGHSIGQIADMPDAKLRKFIEADTIAGPSSEALKLRNDQKELLDSGHIDRIISSARKLSNTEIRAYLTKLTIDFGQNAVVELFIPRLLERIGTGWQKGDLRVVYEHIVTAAVRSYLLQAMERAILPESAPLALAATLPEHIHEIGALAAGVTAISSGFRVLYLGASVPPEEIVTAVIQSRARAVLLSVNYPYRTERLHSDLQLLGDNLPGKTSVFIGGSGLESLDDKIRRLNGKIVRLRDFQSLREVLGSLSLGKGADKKNDEK